MSPVRPEFPQWSRESPRQLTMGIEAIDSGGSTLQDFRGVDGDESIDTSSITFRFMVGWGEMSSKNSLMAPKRIYRQTDQHFTAHFANVDELNFRQRHRRKL